MITPKRKYKLFESFNEKLEKLKDWRLISPKAQDFKTLYYKGAYTQEPIECDVVGFVDDDEIIISVNSELHSIHPAYLKQMQDKKFNKFNFIETSE